MGRKSKTKGKVGEREAAAELSRLFGVECRRGVQYQGGPDSPDVTGWPGMHVEVKRCEALSVYAAMAQAESDAGPGEVPVVLHRRNGKRWLVIMNLDDLPQLVTNGYLALAKKGT